jgi:hypothetical protein
MKSRRRIQAVEIGKPDGIAVLIEHVPKTPGHELSDVAEPPKTMVSRAFLYTVMMKRCAGQECKPLADRSAEFGVQQLGRYAIAAKLREEGEFIGVLEYYRRLHAVDAEHHEFHFKVQNPTRQHYSASEPDSSDSMCVVPTQNDRAPAALLRQIKRI